MRSLINAAAVAALADERVDWRLKGLPAGWSGLTLAQICADAPDLFGAGPLGPVCVLYDDAMRHNLTTMAEWCARHGVELAPVCEVADVTEMVVTAGGSTHFDLVAEVLAGRWRTIVRSGAYLTNDDGLYLRTSPLTRPGAGPGGFVPAMQVWAQVCSRPEPGLALLTMGRRDVSFDQDFPVPQQVRLGPAWTDDVGGCEVVKLNDQHAFLRLSPAAEAVVEVGTWIAFGVSHPCTVFDK